jgi:hypothetical protein
MWIWCTDERFLGYCTKSLHVLSLVSALQLQQVCWEFMYRRKIMFKLALVPYTLQWGSLTLNFKQLIQIFPSISALSLQSTIFHVVAVHQAHLTKHNLSCSLWSTYLDSERCISKGARFQIRSSLLSRGRTFFKNLSGLWTRWLVRVHWFTLNYLNRRMHRLSDINHPLWELRCPLFIHVGSDYEIFIQSTKGYWTTGLMRAQGGEISCAN